MTPTVRADVPLQRYANDDDPDGPGPAVRVS